MFGHYTHASKFGAKTERKFRLLYVDVGAGSGDQAEQIRTLAKAAADADWHQAAARAQAAGKRLGFRQGDAELAQLPESLRRVALKLEAQQRSKVIFAGDRAYILEITALEQRPPLPFEEVEARIAKILKPRATKRAIAAVRDDVVRRAEIVRVATKGNVAPRDR